MPALEQALSKGDQAVAAGLLHSFRGLAGQLGCKQLEMRAQELEQALDAEQQTAWAGPLQALSAALDPLIHHVQRHLPDQPRQ